MPPFLEPPLTILAVLMTTSESSQSTAMLTFGLTVVCVIAIAFIFVGEFRRGGGAKHTRKAISPAADSDHPAAPV